MLKDQGREPQVVRWNRRPLLSELAVNPRVVMRRRVVGVEHLDPRRVEEVDQVPLIFLASGAMEKACTELRDDDEGHADPLCLLDPFDRLGRSMHEVRVAIRVESESHGYFHIDASTRS